MDVIFVASDLFNPVGWLNTAPYLICWEKQNVKFNLRILTLNFEIIFEVQEIVHVNDFQKKKKKNSVLYANFDCKSRWEK